MWKTFFPTKDKDETMSTIFKELSSQLPDKTEDELVPIACIAGLMARVAYADMNIDENEQSKMRKIISSYGQYNETIAKLIIDIASREVKSLVDLENHLYFRPLNELLSKEQRIEILEMLFAVAASDGEVENMESEEIRLIGKSLKLSHEVFIQARYSVKDKLKALR